jgi:CMP-N-acetylneuraminic acid synthetase
MIDGRTVLALIPARGGSKRLPKKNILPLCGKPLIAWTIEAALQSKYVDQVLVSTDCSEIAAVSRQSGAEVPFLRPVELAGDTSSTNDVILHALGTIPHFIPDLVVILQPTSPLRTAAHIDESLQLLVDNNAKGIVSVSECEHSPLWANNLPENNQMGKFIRPTVIGKRSQDLPVYYRLNGAIYAFTKDSLLSHGGVFYSNDVYAFKMDRDCAVDIDNELDFQFAEVLMKASKKKHWKLLENNE